MPPGRRQTPKQLFEELGLLEEAQAPVNPYNSLGIDLGFARELLADDSTGETLRSVADGMYKVIARRYHPDTNSDHPERYQAAEEANRQLSQAPLSALSRWTKADSAPASPSQGSGLQNKLAATAGRVADLLHENFEYGQHPLHFSSLWAAQGVLLKRGSRTLLLRQQQSGGVSILPGTTAKLEGGVGKARHMSQVFDFQSFMRAHKSFGLEPGTTIATYIDENRRASILRSDLSFLMDISDPVADHRKLHAQASLKSDSAKSEQYKTFWLRSPDPLLFITQTPGAESEGEIEAQFIQFDKHIAGAGTGLGRAMGWDIPMEVAGSVADESFFKRVQYGKAAARIAISGGSSRTARRYFQMAATQARHIIEQDAGYSPLLTHGNRLLLYDRTSGSPVATDATIIGMVGSNARAS